MKKTGKLTGKVFTSLFILTLLVFFVSCGGGSGSSGDDDGNGGNGSESTVVSGVVRDENGLPVSDAKVEAISTGTVTARNTKTTFEATTDEDGTFSIEDITLENFHLQVSKSGRNTVVISGFSSGGTYGTLSITQGEGSQTISFELPSPITLSVTSSRGSASLSWTQSQSSNFSSYAVMRSTSSGVTALDDQVGKFTNASSNSMTDRNLTAGTWYYRVFQVIDTESGEFMLGSNQESLEIDSSVCFPSRISIMMLKTLPVPGTGGLEHQSRFVVTTTDIRDTIPAGMDVTVDSALFSAIQTARYSQMSYKNVEHYYYGNPAYYLGEINMPGEWDSKYFVTKDDFSADEVIGTHSIDINGETVNFGQIDDAMPNNKVYGVSISRNRDDQLQVSWSMVEDGSTFSGGEGSYGWKYLVKVMYAGQYAGGDDPDYQWEKYWSNVCIKDCNFVEICSRLENMPQVSDNTVTIPDGIFDSGDSVKVSVYAISSNESNTTADSGVDGYAKSYLYWLYRGGASLEIP